MKAINGKKKQSQNRFQRQRRALLAKVHIAPKELGMSKEAYDDILLNEFGVASASALSNSELDDLVAFFVSKGWRPKKRRTAQGTRRTDGQVLALRERAEALAGQIENGEKRLNGLCKKICGVEKLEWCRDVAKLLRLLKVLGEIVGKDR